jgi:flavin reductase (DIM6/NTAB) family NADH-FMN oxidoreductase RutF
MIENKEKKRINLAPGALTAPLPPALVTVGDEEYANILTVAWTGILSTVPPRTYISVRPSRHSYAILKEKGEFVINLASADMARSVDFAGIYTGKKMNKFDACGFTPIPSEKVSAPTVAQCPLALECKVFDVIPMGSHDVFMADIVSVSCREDIMGEDGRLMLDMADLLAYAHGEYFALGEKLGRFGFSTDKGKKSGLEEKNKKGEKSKTKILGEGKSKDKSKAPKEREASKARTDGEHGAKGGDPNSFSGKFGAEKKAFEDGEGGRIAKGDGKVPFYLGLPKGRAKRSPEERKNKGKPHGKRRNGGDGRK